VADTGIGISGSQEPISFLASSDLSSGGVYGTMSVVGIRGQINTGGSNSSELVGSGATLSTGTGSGGGGGTGCA
jgi:hypothetical protein